jgi:type II secretory ATPase GspE/PulE/Tfp pilus assembly ATPase PilB-like protein
MGVFNQKSPDTTRSTIETIAPRSVLGSLRHVEIDRSGDLTVETIAISKISELSAFDLTLDKDILAALCLADNEKTHPIVVTDDWRLLVVNTPSLTECEKIRSVKDLVKSKTDSETTSLTVERAVLRSWIVSYLESSRSEKQIINTDCEDILSLAEEIGATDIHIDRKGMFCDINYRASGVFCRSSEISGDVGTNIIKSFWEVYAKDGISGDYVKDGRFSRKTRGVEYLYRLSYGSSKALGIESLAIRARNMRDVPSLSQLGYSECQLKAMKESVGVAGLVMICGSVNSGKSTFQAAWQQMLPADQFNLEISDQVEVLLPNFTQLQKPSEGKAEHIREQTQRLYKLPTRHDIDFIAINEIRDFDTAQLMQDLMQLGTPGITSIHAKGWPEAVNRMRSTKMAINDQTLFGEGFFNAIAYQTLGRVLCSCKLANHPDPFWQEYFTSRLGGGLFFRNSEGCEKCGHTGINGLTAVAEFIPIRNENRHFLRDTTNNTAMYQWMHDNEHLTIFEHALGKIKKGILDPQMIRQKLGDFDKTNIFDAYELK